MAVATLKQWLDRFRDACPTLGVLIIGATGVGKSTLVNNLLGEDLAEEGDSVESATSTVNCYKGEIQNVPVVVYDTPGLGDSREDRDKAYLKEIKAVLGKKQIHVVIYCFKMNETSMSQGLIRTIQQYHAIGIKWEITMFALTFADGLTPSSKLKRKPDFSMTTYFDGRLEEWRKKIPQVLVKDANVDEKLASAIKINPTVDDPKVKLPNGTDWFVPFWLDMVSVLPTTAMVRFLDIYKDNIRYDDRDTRVASPVIVNLISPQTAPPRSQSSPHSESLRALTSFGSQQIVSKTFGASSSPSNSLDQHSSLPAEVLTLTDKPCSVNPLPLQRSCRKNGSTAPPPSSSVPSSGTIDSPSSSENNSNQSSGDRLNIDLDSPTPSPSSSEPSSGTIDSPSSSENNSNQSSGDRLNLDSPTPSPSSSEPSSGTIDSPSSSENNSNGGRPNIPMDSPTRDKFEDEVGRKINDEISSWETVKGVFVGTGAGAVAGTALGTAGVVAAGVALAPFVAAGAAVGAIGAGISKLFGWW